MSNMIPFFTLTSILLNIGISRALIVPSSVSTDAPLPLIIWHGLGDSFDADGLASVSKLAKKIYPDIYTYNIRLAEDGSGDRRATFFGNLTEQVAQVCEDLASHPVLGSATQVDALGFSQGGQFLRAYVERCNNPPVRSLVTFGSQHNGVSKFKSCGATDWLCKAAFALLTSSTWSTFVQSSLVPAQYYRNPEELDEYLEHSNFLADINNERVLKNQTYKANLQTLEKFVMYVFEEDETVVPKLSGWFAEINETSGGITPLRNRTLYKDDWLGLKKIDERGGLVFEKTPGKHMQLDDKLLTHVFKSYFGPKSLTTGVLSSILAGPERIMTDTRELWEDL